ncbi:hypothetical protein LIER_12396 [Lithospermum erythrorhizon]|uniref:Uncharacterized protein n=1 Tax=Lithospermum erythrorhizon TaxID=34254 RepID=A0AAV3PRR0_LITER
MPLTTFIADALGVVTICLVAVLFIFCIFCILYLLYFHSRIHSQGFTQLSYFGGPWIIRITFILFSLCWGFGEILRLNLLRHHGRLLKSLDVKWQKNVCKGYILSNLGFAEPCFFLTLAFILRASLQNSGPLGRKWNGRTAAQILLFCVPMFVSQLMVILIGPLFKMWHKLPSYFIRSASNTKADDGDDITCTYPLLSTILLGLFASILSTYFFWIGRRILHLVINKVLLRRVYTLIFSVPGLLLLRVLLLGISVHLKPGGDVFEAVTFLAFLSLVFCIGVCICILGYFPVADSLDLGNMLTDIEDRRRFIAEHNEAASLIANRSQLGESSVSSPVRTSETSTKRGSISFRVLEKDEGSPSFVELSVFSPGVNSTPPGSPRLDCWPMLPMHQFIDPES